MTYYRRIWAWSGAAWQLFHQDYVEYYGGDIHPDHPPCVPPFDAGTNSFKTSAGCSAGVTEPGSGVTLDPPLYEVWWKWVPSTWGSGSGGSWKRLSAGSNY